LRADDGEMVWHYQTTPGDSWDFTATQPLMLANLRIGGRYRRVIMQAPKNGFFSVIDRENGQFISAAKYGEVTWASGIDSVGRPIVSEAMANPEAPTVVAPGPWGAHSWHPMSYNPATGLVYFAVQNAPFLHNVDERWQYNPAWLNVGIDERYVGPEWTEMERIPVTGHLVAWDPVNQREAWRADHPTFGSGGTLTTAGNLVFQGRADGMLLAYRATDGKALWQFNTGTAIGAPPITYAIDGVQYVAIMAGRGGPDVLQNANTNRGSRVGPGRLLAFALGGSATLPPFDTTTRPVPMPSFRLPATNPQVAEGAMLYGIWCARCHGLHAASGGIIPDLRYASTATHETFDQIVRGGARMHLGMPRFADELTPEQVRLVQAYVLHLARAAARGSQRRARP
jgi:quinohemoprotein ethanol dehydrogenase